MADPRKGDRFRIARAGDAPRRIESFEALARKHGDKLRNPRIFSASDMRLLEEHRRTDDKATLMAAAGVTTVDGLERALTRIARTGAAHVTELTGLKRQLQLHTLIRIVEGRVDDVGTLQTASGHVPDPDLLRKRVPRPPPLAEG